MDAQVLGDLKMAVIRVSFPTENYPGVSGNGEYLYTAKRIECGDYTIDPPPHDRNYFRSHLEAADNYFRSVSYNKFGLDLNNSAIYPLDNESSYLINKPMNYYNEINQDEFHEKRITELLRDAIIAAFEEDQINFNQFDLITVIHPGVGQDFNLPFLDPTPEDIPSTYVDKNMVNTHLGGPITIGDAAIPHGIIIPETQNHLFYDETLFDQLGSPCDIQYSITGTLALMMGFAAGLPPLWDLESGLSGVGVFGLMDQGSNNGRGIIPAPPDAWTRTYAGWETPAEINYNDLVNIISGEATQIAKIPIGKDEYFLIENRNNWFRDGVSIDSARFVVWQKTNIYPEFINVLIDSMGVEKNEYGVITDVPNYDWGLPASGLLIWHIDEQKIRDGIDSFSINADRKHRGIDLEEADGAQDIGYVSNLFTDPSSGYWGDMWFAENQEYFRANADGSMDFSSFTHPNTKSNSGANSGINISNISKAGESISFTLSSSYDMAFLKDENKSILFQWDVDGDGDLDFIGEGDSLWWGDDIDMQNSFRSVDGKYLQVCVVQNSSRTSLAVMQDIGNDKIIEWFEFDADINNFVKVWDYKLAGHTGKTFFYADGIEKEIHYFASFIHRLINKDGVIELEEYSNKSVAYYSNNNPTVIIYNGIEIEGGEKIGGEFGESLIVDLDLDGALDIVVREYLNAIKGFDLQLNFKNGFPTNGTPDGPLYAIDLLEDEKPEIIYQTSNGKVKILNHEGKTLEELFLGENSQLRSLGIYEGHNSIITNNRVIKFKKDDGKRVNEWIHREGSPDHSRFLLLPEPFPGNESILFDKSLTYAYPNPSYGEVVIFRVQVGTAESIKINIFDIAGFPVQTLKKSMKIENSPISDDTSNHLPGVEEIKWDISNVESGIYLARVVVSKDGNSEEKIINVGIIK